MSNYNKNNKDIINEEKKINKTLYTIEHEIFKINN